jgi:hypothetical protein
MNSRLVLFTHTWRLTVILVAVFALVSFGMAAPQSADKPLRCGSDLKLDTVLNHPEDYFGTTVTVEGEMHRTFSDKVFSIEDDDFLRDDDLLIITNSSKSEVVRPVEDSIEEGEDVCVTGVIQPFNRSEMESKFGPLNIESRASHYPEGSPVMIIEQTKADADLAPTSDLEKPLPPSTDETTVEPVTEPAAPTDLDNNTEAEVNPQPETETPPAETVNEQPETNTELPETASPLPLIGLSGVFSLLAAAGIRLSRRF